MKIVLAATTALVLVGVAQAQQTGTTQSGQRQTAGSEADYIARIKRAAPPEVVDDATVVRFEGSEMRTIKKGTNEWTCMINPTDTPMCMDPNAMEWAHAWQTHGPEPQKTGFIYMLSGDTGASNTDPYATQKTADNHWVETGPHVMIVGATVKSMPGYPRTADANADKPYIMWPGTPYEHLMLPVRQAR